MLLQNENMDNLLLSFNFNLIRSSCGVTEPVTDTIINRNTL